MEPIQYEPEPFTSIARIPIQDGVLFVDCRRSELRSRIAITVIFLLPVAFFGLLILSFASRGGTTIFLTWLAILSGVMTLLFLSLWGTGRKVSNRRIGLAAFPSKLEFATASGPLTFCEWQSEQVIELQVVTKCVVADRELGNLVVRSKIRAPVEVFRFLPVLELKRVEVEINDLLSNRRTL